MASQAPIKPIIAAGIAAISLAVVGAAPASARIAPLTLKEAKTEAVWRGWNFPVTGNISKVKPIWTIRWSSWKIAVGVEADGSVTTTDSYYNPCQWISPYGTCYSGYNDYSYTTETWAIATVTVTKNSHTGIVRTRVSDMSTWDN